MSTKAQLLNSRLRENTSDYHRIVTKPNKMSSNKGFTGYNIIHGPPMIIKALLFSSLAKVLSDSVLPESPLGWKKSWDRESAGKAGMIKSSGLAN